MAERPESEDRLAGEQERAAAAEAARIGGADPDPGIDPADRPVREGGGGEAEGFEIAEEDLVRHATHEDPGGDPLSDAFTPEAESDRSGAEYGEADEAIPRDGPDDGAQ
jgi:hypothetical protein